MKQREIELSGNRIIEKVYTGSTCGGFPHFNYVIIADFSNRNDAERCFQVLKSSPKE